MPNINIRIDPLHWLYPLHSLHRLNQALDTDALQTIVPREAYGHRRQVCVDDYYPLGRLRYSGGLLLMHSDGEALGSHDTWWLHGLGQVLLWLTDSQHRYRRRDLDYAHAHCLGVAHFQSAKDRSLDNLCSRLFVSIDTREQTLRKLTVDNRTLIFDIVRLVSLVELSKAGDDITCMGIESS